MTDKIRPPWTPEQVSALNRFQQYGGMHPFTCGGKHDGPSLILMAHRDGWHCSDPACGYRQNWAHAFMATPDAWPQSPIRSYPDELRERAEADTDAIANRPIVGLAAPTCPEHQDGAECPCPPGCYCCQPEPAELTAEEARDLVDELGLQLYRVQDALAFVAECCDIAEREQRAITVADVREWLKGAQCGRQLAADPQRQQQLAAIIQAAQQRHTREQGEADSEPPVLETLGYHAMGQGIDLERAEQQRDRLAATLREIDPAKLDLLADWFDTDDARRGPGHDAGPSVADCAEADARWWNGEKAGE